MQQTKNSCCKIKRWHCVLFSLLFYLIIISFDFKYNHLNVDTNLDQIELVNVGEKDSNPYHTSLPIPIYGEDKYCDPIRKKEFGYKYNTAVIMGLYDTGTNVVLELLMSNCWGLSTGNSWYNQKYTSKEFDSLMRSNVKDFKNWQYSSLWNYTKHQPSPSWQFFGENMRQNNHSILHQQLNVVFIKDILTWIKSICKQNYYIFPIRDTWFQNNLCPYNISNNNGTASASEWHTNVYSSVVDLWNKYYMSWMGSDQTPPQGGTDFVKTKWRKLYQYAAKKFNVESQKAIGRKELIQKMYVYLLDNKYDSFNEKERELIHDIQKMRTNINAPSVVVRFEDVLFHPDQVINRLCKCVGGYRRAETIIRQTANKPHGHSRNRTEALTTYSNRLYRYQNYGKTDLQFIKQNVNHTIMNIFGYNISTTFNETMEMLVANNIERKKFYHFY